MTSPATPGAIDNTLCLPDGRRLGYAEYGSPAGMPVLFFHGAPGSRRSIFADMAEAAAQHGIRLIAPDRPGYGLSDPLNGRSVRDWTTDVLTLTNALGIDRFNIIGFSTGSQFALDCAHALPTQVDRVAIVGGLAPMGIAGVTTEMSAAVRSLYDLARSDPGGLREIMAPLVSSPASLLAAMMASAQVADQALLAARSSWFEQDFAEVLQSGVEGMACDFVLSAGEWLFSLEEIQANVDLWIGTEDRNTPLAMTRHLASMLPYSQLFELSGEGHFCLYTHWNEILDRFF
jgi:pimeloyl-ACP methyl ester carboxylesterase